jgi:hypothetical protein
LIQPIFEEIRIELVLIALVDEPSLQGAHKTQNPNPKIPKPKPVLSEARDIGCYLGWQLKPKFDSGTSGFNPQYPISPQ